jgi:hypothetical protein
MVTCPPLVLCIAFFTPISLRDPECGPSSFSWLRCIPSAEQTSVPITDVEVFERHLQSTGTGPHVLLESEWAWSWVLGSGLEIQFLF